MFDLQTNNTGWSHKIADSQKFYILYWFKAPITPWIHDEPFVSFQNKFNWYYTPSTLASFDIYNSINVFHSTGGATVTIYFPHKRQWWPKWMSGQVKWYTFWGLCKIMWPSLKAVAIANSCTKLKVKWNFLSEMIWGIEEDTERCYIKGNVHRFSQDELLSCQ